MDIDSLDPMPLSRTEADTLAFALRRNGRSFTASDLRRRSKQRPQWLSSFRGRPNFFFGLPDFVAVVVFVGFFVSFFAFGLVNDVDFFVLVVDAFLLLKGADDVD